MTILNNLNPPEGFHITHMIFLDPEWQVNLKDEEHVIVATGSDIEAALAAAKDKALNGDYAGRLFSLAPLKHVTLAQSLIDLVLGPQAKPDFSNFKRRV